MKTELGTKPNELEIANRILMTQLWFMRHGDNIYDHLNEYHIIIQKMAQIEEQLHEGVLNAVDKQKRLYEEMPLCRLWTYLPSKLHPIPFGFEIVKGSIRLTDDRIWNQSGKGRFDHVFLRSKDQKIIIDHCPAQFVKGRYEKGDRLDTLKNHAPRLFHDIETERGNHLTLLIALQEDVQNQLSIEYHNVPRRME